MGCKWTVGMTRALLVGALVWLSWTGLVVANTPERGGSGTYRVTMTIAVEGFEPATYSFVVAEGERVKLSTRARRPYLVTDRSETGKEGKKNDKQEEAAPASPKVAFAVAGFSCRVTLHRRETGVITIEGTFDDNELLAEKSSAGSTSRPTDFSYSYAFTTDVAPGEDLELTRISSPKTPSLSVTLRVDPIGR